jgi:hypothetical protein
MGVSALRGVWLAGKVTKFSDKVTPQNTPYHPTWADDLNAAPGTCKSAKQTQLRHKSS